LPITIFDRDSGPKERSLVLNDDGTVTYDESNSGWRMARRGSESRRETMTAQEAKTRWPRWAPQIDGALVQLALKQQNT